MTRVKWERLLRGGARRETWLTQAFGKDREGGKEGRMGGCTHKPHNTTPESWSTCCTGGGTGIVEVNGSWGLLVAMFCFSLWSRYYS